MDEGLVRSLLDTSFEHLANPGKRSDFTDQRWSTGQDALEVLRTRSVEYLAVPELYDISEDLWVAGRTRELWVQTLRRAAAEHGLDVAGALAQRVEERVLGNWRALSQLARYNRTYLARGRRPRMAFAEILGHLADEEGALVEEYGGMFT
jgi:hypothetical protein